jgi:hypothetical protein
MMNYQIGNKNHVEGILALQSKYLFANMSEDDRKNGFVTTPFTIAQIDTLLVREGVFVATLDDKVVAYCFAASWDFFAQWAIFPYMMSRTSLFDFQGIALTHDNSFQYGPVCFDEAVRGHDVFPNLFALMRKTMSKHYPIGGTFINQINVRSVKAHTTKLDLEIVDEFSFNNNNYYTLAFFTA